MVRHVAAHNNFSVYVCGQSTELIGRMTCVVRFVYSYQKTPFTHGLDVVWPDHQQHASHRLH